MSGKKYVWGMYGVVLIFVVYSMLGRQIQVWDGYGAFYSVADCMAAACRPDILFLCYIVFTIVLILKEEKVFLRDIFIIPYITRRNLWKHQYMRILRISLYCSVYYTGITIALGALSSPQWMNWGSSYSMFFRNTGHVFQGSFWVVMGLFLLFTWFKTVFSVWVLSALDWWGIKKIYGWTAIIALFIGEWVDSQFTIFFRLFSISYANFKYWYVMAGICILALVLCAGIYKIGEAGVERKEIYHD